MSDSDDMIFTGLVPPPPPLPDLSAPLQVKRLNWETHQPDEIHETVWCPWRSDEQLEFSELVDSLELTQQFSTVKKKPGNRPTDQHSNNSDNLATEIDNQFLDNYLCDFIIIVITLRCRYYNDDYYYYYY